MHEGKPEVYVVDDETVIAETLAMISGVAAYLCICWTWARKALLRDGLGSMNS